MYTYGRKKIWNNIIGGRNKKIHVYCLSNAYFYLLIDLKLRGSQFCTVYGIENSRYYICMEIMHRRHK